MAVSVFVCLNEVAVEILWSTNTELNAGQQRCAQVHIFLVFFSFKMSTPRKEVAYLITVCVFWIRTGFYPPLKRHREIIIHQRESLKEIFLLFVSINSSWANKEAAQRDWFGSSWITQNWNLFLYLISIFEKQSSFTTFQQRSSFIDHSF